ncbi:MAG: choice-of-anchor E domain-containing protein [Cyanobacteria bacterium P01_G01_bin.38]
MVLKSLINLGHTRGCCLRLGTPLCARYGLAVTTTSLAIGLGTFLPAAAATFTADIGPQSPGPLQAISTIPQYQPQPGETLLDVTLELSGGLQGSVDIDNPTQRAQSVRVSLVGNLALFGPQSQRLLSTSPRFATTQSISKGSAGLQLTDLKAITPDLGEGAPTLTLSAQTPYVTENFVGNGLLDLSFLAVDTSGVQGSKTLESRFSTQAKATVRVSYNTQPTLQNPPPEPLSVPEPSVIWGMIAGGLFSRGWWIEKTRNSKVR